MTGTLPSSLGIEGVITHLASTHIKLRESILSTLHHLLMGDNEGPGGLLTLHVFPLVSNKSMETPKLFCKN